MSEPKKIITLKGKPLALVGLEPRVRQEAPDFKLLAIVQHPEYNKAIQALKIVAAS